jgi:hypothetical protein
MRAALSWCCLLATVCSVIAAELSSRVPDACSLLSKAEVEAAVRRTVLVPKREPIFNICNCLYGDPQAPPDKLEPAPIVSVSVFVGGMEERFPGFPKEAKDTFEMMKKSATTPRPIAELGDDAYWENSRRELVILRGKYMTAIKLQPDSGDQPAAKVLAAKVLERLPR